MDTKNEDSAGSDSLDKSLQKKCVMEDAGQGETKGNTFVEKLPIENSIKAQKSGANSIRHDVAAGDHECEIDTTVKIKTQQLTNFKGNAAETGDGEVANCNDNKKIDKPAICNNNNAFETKVKQISKNLKETTLAECAANKKTSLADSATTSTSSCSASNSSTSSSSSSSPNFELPSTSRAALSRLSSSNVKSNTSTPAEALPNAETETEASEEQEEQDEEQRSKKVRFHPNVKEADGTSRVIPKKKKKLKSSTASDEETEAATTSSNENEMELDAEEETDEENEVFNFDKTIADAAAYLKEHPLTFVCTFDESSNDDRLPNGLLDANKEKEDLSTLPDNDDDVYVEAESQNGIERILGRQTVGDKTSYLLRYAERVGVFWETEEFVTTNCPKLLNLYEQNLQKRQQRLRRYVDDRLNYRQRYTDF